MVEAFQSSSESSRALQIHVADPRHFSSTSAGRGITVFVEPLYGCVAVAAALDAGWESVVIDREHPETAPIPLVSYEQRPTATVCRVRCDDLALAPNGALLGCPANARPLASLIARSVSVEEDITFVPALSEGEMAADSWWAAGMLIRVLLEELDQYPSFLSDAAGMAVILAQGAEVAEQMLMIGSRWRRHCAHEANRDDLRVASAVDTIGVVPVIEIGDVMTARAMSLIPEAGLLEGQT